MTARRLLGTAIGMAAVAVALGALTPSAGETWTALRHPQTTTDLAGPDVLVLHLTGLLAWSVWSWGALGLALTAASALPGPAGRLASGAVARVLPAAARRAAAVALGVGLGLTAPATGPAPGPAGTGTAVAQEVAPGAAVQDTVPDWPAASPPGPPAGTPGSPGPPSVGLPDWPHAAGAGDHVVVRGECLWDIAERRLTGADGRNPRPAEVAAAVRAWWQANAEVIGPDPDHLLPGQVLRPPAHP